MRRRLAAAVLAAAVHAAAWGCAATASAQTIDTKTFNVVGTWNYLTNWQKLEKPFWTEDLDKASGGKLKGNIKAVNEFNLKGTELLRLLKQGVFDFAFALPIYVEDGAAVIEGLDIAGVARDFKMAKDVADLWLPEIQKVMRERHNAIILSTHVWPEQNFYCRGEIKTVEDLKGKSIRVQGQSQSDLATALGASSVTIGFGEVMSALQKDIIECAITGTMPAYKAKWHEVTNTLFRLPVGFTVGFLVANLTTWNKLSADTRALIEKEVKSLEERSWKSTQAETEEGVYCTTGTGGCPAGPAGKLKLSKPSAADLKARDKALNETVLKSWAKRCGIECAARWTELIGTKYGLTAKAD